MNKIEIPVDRAIELYKFVSVGKLMGGLVHNMNGPLHSLGIEMDVLNFLMDKGIESVSEFIESLKKRLKRMEEEFERLNLLIRSTSERVEFNSFIYKKTDINKIVKQELEFLNANLYFKHKVEKLFELLPDIKLDGDLSENTLLGLQWFVQGLVEDIEKQKITKLKVKSYMKESKICVEFEVGEPGLSPGFTQSLKWKNDSLSTEIGNLDFGLSLALVLLDSGNIDILAEESSPFKKICLCFPK